jgi:hypothetical protein
MALSAAQQEDIAKLVSEHVPVREISRRLGIPRTTVQRLVARRNELRSLFEAPGIHGPAVEGEMLVNLRYEDLKRMADWMADHGSELQELIDWWQQRQRQRVYDSLPRETSRQTYHVETQWIELIRKEADAEGVSLMQVVNRAFRAYFESK